MSALICAAAEARTSDILDKCTFLRRLRVSGGAIAALAIQMKPSQEMV